MRFRTKRLPPELLRPYEGFRETVHAVDEAKRRLTAAVPNARTRGTPFAVALFEFEDVLMVARDVMGSWRAPGVETQWRAADLGIGRSLALARSIRERGDPPEGFEGLIALVDDLLAPLDALQAAGDRFGELRTRSLRD